MVLASNNSSAWTLDDYDEMEFGFLTGPVVTDSRMYIALTSSSSFANTAVGVIGDLTGVGTGWRSMKLASAVVTSGADSGVSIVANTWYAVLMKRTGTGAFDITIEGNGQAATVSVSGIAFNNFIPGFRITNLAAAAKTLIVDYTRRTTRPLTRF